MMFALAGEDFVLHGLKCIAVECVVESCQYVLNVVITDFGRRLEVVLLVGIRLTPMWFCQCVLNTASSGSA